MAKPVALPKDRNAELIPLVPPQASEAVTVDDTISSTTETTFQTGTNFLEVYGNGGAVYFKWGTDDASASDFDHIIPEGGIRHLIVPSGTVACNVIEKDSGAGIVIIEFKID